MTRARRLLAAATAAVVSALALLLGSAWMAPLPERLDAAGSPMVLYADGTVAHVFLSPDERWRVPVTVEDVDPGYVEALLRYEDKRFWLHPGVDPMALARAIVQNISQQRVVSGASTLTLQLVRVLEPRPRTLRSKLVEMWRAISIEMHLSKREILEAYLSFTPYGKNVEGIEAASLAYFGHRPDQLSPAEIATLLAVPQSPSRRYPTPENARRLREARDEIAAFLCAENALDAGRDAPADVLSLVTTAPVPTALRPFPREAPHAAFWLRARAPHAMRIPTTLDPGTQRLVEQSLEEVRAERARQGIYSTAVVVVDPGTARIQALVGGFDFWDEEHGGQILAFDVPRSPGSALKPFLYAMAIDEGRVLPEMLSLDVPVAYGTYIPKNYDDRFQGLVRYEEALSRSLNLPFVFLLEDLGVERFLADLRQMGAHSLSDQSGHYGLSVAAGGIELTALEMAGLYATLANGGEYRELSIATGDGEPARIYSAGSTWLTRRALMLRDRPDFPLRGALSQAPRGIAWKTGTSFGHRDAWAAGWDAEHVAVVWMGNVDNRPSSHLVGAESSATVLFDILEGLADRNVSRADEGPPADLVEVEVCSYSGHVPGRACPHTRHVLALETQVPTETCPYHVAIDVDLASGRAVGPGCRGTGEVQTRSFVRWPASVRRWLDDEHRHLPDPPAWAPGCEIGATGSGPRILQPREGQVAVLIPGIPAEDQEIPLEAEARDALAWFVDGEFLGSAAAHERLWWTPRPGEHELMVVDEGGRSDRRALKVVARR